MMAIRVPFTSKLETVYDIPSDTVRIGVRTSMYARFSPFRLKAPPGVDFFWPFVFQRHATKPVWYIQYD